MKRFPTPVCDGIAADSRRHSLRLWLELARKERHFEVFRADRMRLQGYLDALHDESAITDSEFVAASGELNAWFQEWLA